jgi:hypothetical protein
MLTFMEADSSDLGVLDELKVGAFDHVLVLCNDDVDSQLADSRTLVTLLYLRDMEQRSGRQFSIVSEMADDRNRALAEITQADDFIVSEKLISLLTTQISENPHLASVFANLFDADGSDPCEPRRAGRPGPYASGSLPPAGRTLICSGMPSSRGMHSST